MLRLDYQSTVLERNRTGEGETGLEKALTIQPALQRVTMIYSTNARKLFHQKTTYAAKRLRRFHSRFSQAGFSKNNVVETMIATLKVR